MLHGFTGGPGCWDLVLAELPRDVRSRRPFLLGHGPSPAGADVETFSGEVDRLAAWLGARGERFHLAGYSMGGRLALGLLVRHRHLFSAATLIGVSPGLPGAEARRQRAEIDEARARGLESEGLARFVDDWETLPLFASQAALPAGVRRQQRERRLGHRAEGLARALRILSPASMPDFRPELAALDLPIHLLAGALDHKFCRLAREMWVSLPRAEVEIVPGVGHNVLLEAPRSVARALRRR